MITKASRSKIRVKKHMKMRNKLQGTTERPRLAVYRSEKHIYAQIIDDTKGSTLVSASTVEKELAKALEATSNVDAAKAVGEAVAKKALAKGINEVVFDRGGFLYHGRVKALADAARAAGLQF
ncbi:50S ribosomal protein L18 [Cellulosilyticum sp. I15G10I2]|uniref:50S ribosomal protein L18 n=1 Tax=Cellulosilyticum sp. I15G10I2 TaxID=1892843 RepID=UPI00085CB4B8|nr:50S ribosomal protein L18 [Cellulosilyticum sp. I15G10I2]